MAGMRSANGLFLIAARKSNSPSLAAFLGFWIAYAWDLPVGPTDVVLLGILFALGFVVKKIAALVG